MGLQLSISWEPRITPISLSLPVAKLQAEDDAGNDLINVDRREATLTANVQHGISAIELELPFRLPNRGARKIASLKGEMEALVPGRVASFEFTDLEDAEEEQQTRAGVTVTLEEMRKNLDLYQLRINVRFDKASNALESHRGWILRNEAAVIDAEGQLQEFLNLEVTQARTENAIGLAYLFDLESGPKGCKFVYKTPALIIKMPVEYELKDIPLP